MLKYPKPIIGVSRCLGFEACRYNGEMISDEGITLMKPYVDFINVCPEVDIGMSIPRDTIRLVKNKGKIELVEPKSRNIYTDKMINYAYEFATSHEFEGIILKSKSPSCGSNNIKIYHDFDGKHAIEKGKGVFYSEILKNHSSIPIEDEGRLRNFTIREQFYTTIFTLARFRDVQNTGCLGALNSFHAKNKYLFLAHNQSIYHTLGKFLDNKKCSTVNEIFLQYRNCLHTLLKKGSSPRRYIFVCQKIYSQLSSNLSMDERNYFHELLGQYLIKEIPLSSVLGVLKAWIIRFHSNKLEEQYFFEPYPRALVKISDSGKGRNYS